MVKSPCFMVKTSSFSMVNISHFSLAMANIFPYGFTMVSPVFDGQMAAFPGDGDLSRGAEDLQRRGLGALPKPRATVARFWIRGEFTMKEAL